MKVNGYVYDIDQTTEQLILDMLGLKKDSTYGKVFVSVVTGYVETVQNGESLEVYNEFWKVIKRHYPQFVDQIIKEFNSIGDYKLK